MRRTTIANCRSWASIGMTNLVDRGELILPPFRGVRGRMGHPF